MYKIELTTEFKDTVSEFQDLISSFNEEQFNKVPFEGGWTPAQVARHINMANSGFAEVLKGPVAVTERAPDELIERIKADFLNFGIKMTSPDFLYPELKTYDKGRLLETLETTRQNISKIITDLDLEPTCLAFELPGYGHLTRLEAIWFVIAHMQRHAEQLKKIKQHYSLN